ncbi:MAG: PadR family transcriptional regulator [Candidatus Micrarchaeia archaeon]|jgi:DNA-binding PadR family transcriptional regulator
MEKELLERIKSIALELKLLRCIGRGEAYPYSLLKELQNLKIGEFKLSKSDVYNAIGSLERKDYIKLSRQVGAKKYYKLTSNGRKALSSAKRILLKTMEEISKML